MKISFHGVVNGSRIELTEDPGLPPGQSVRVTVEPTTPSASGGVREALQRAAGTWCDRPDELDRYLEWNRQQRKGGRRGVAE